MHYDVFTAGYCDTTYNSNLSHSDVFSLPVLAQALVRPPTITPITPDCADKCGVAGLITADNRCIYRMSTWN